MNELKVGDYLEGTSKPIYEGVSARFDDSGLVILATFEAPTNKEKTAYKKGRLKTKLFSTHGVTFLLYQLGDLPWCDAPLLLMTENLPELDDPELGISAMIILADSRDSKIYSVRLIGLDHDLSKSLIETAHKLPMFDGNPASPYLATARMIQSTMTTLDMVHLAT